MHGMQKAGWLVSLVLTGLIFSAGFGSAEEKKITKFARFQAGEEISYGIVEGDLIRKISGDLFGTWKKTDKSYPLATVKLLVPCKPTQVLAMAGNYRSHLAGEEKPPLPNRHSRQLPSDEPT